MNAYDPSVVAIGPYHHDTYKKRPTLKAMHDHKWHCVWRLLLRSTNSKTEAPKLLSKCLKAMKSMDAAVRSRYAEDLANMTSRELALIMLLDGCFIIHVLLNYNGDMKWGGIPKRVKLGEINDNEDSQEEEDDIAAGHEDDQEEEDIAAELQYVMEEEEDITAGHEYVKHLIEMFPVTVKEIEIHFQVIQLNKVWDTILLDLVKVENQIPFFIIQTLFDKLKTSGDNNINLVKIADKLLRPLHPSHSKSSTTTLPEQSGSKRSTTTPSEDVHHLLHLFHSKLDFEIEWVPSVTELQLAGVEFVDKKGSDVSFLDISFKDGTIEIPKVNLHGTTISLFRNLIAYEQCNYRFIEGYVTAYASFMDYMINTPKDVELFELKGIFINQLGTPDHAATFINQLCHHNQDRGNNYLQGSMREIKNYYNSKWHKWRAGLKRDHFKNPWTIASLVAAVILLLLTVEQSFFAAYSYFRPPS
ncbi:Armadillo-like helical-containing protein [Dioscorea alata]|uniref:Armadillo-like helical-containing protein n=1 Tax=Dioscorea alata TaxID=55571 RepID=A0ACB7ULI6_DIOAL|nr:Armadillo-like helical-containing protein [Dioscorea alata]